MPQDIGRDDDLQGNVLMGFDVRTLAAETAFGSAAAVLDGTLPGLGAGAITFVRQLLDTRTNSKDSLDAFIDCMADHLDTLRRESAEHRIHDVDESARTTVVTVATAVLRGVPFDAREYLTDHAEDAATAARSLVAARAMRAGLPPEPYLRDLVYQVVEAWFRAMAESPVGRGEVERAFRQTLLDRTEPLGDDLAALRDVLLSTPILRSGREPYRRGEEPPSALLDPRFAIVPFQGRESELEALTVWCDDVDGPRVSVRLVTGPGGRGKTRLVSELARRLRERSDGRATWRAGLLDLLGTSLAPERLAQEFRVHDRVLIGIDRAEVRREDVVAVLRAARLHAGDCRVRVLLTARRADAWWRTLGSFDPEAARALQVSPAEPLELDVLVPTVDDRAEHFVLARNAFRSALAEGTASDGSLESPSALQDEALADPLLLQMAALLSAQGRSVVADETSLFKAMLDSESSYWAVELSRHGPQSLRDTTIEEAATVLTLLQGTTDRSSLKALVTQVLERAARDSAAADTITDLLHVLYGADDMSTRPVQPDRLGEYLVLENVERLPRLLDTALDLPGDRGDREAARVAVLTVLTRLAGWHRDGRLLLRALLERRLDDLIEAVLDVARGTGDPIGMIATEALEASAEAADIAELTIDTIDSLPGDSLALRELAELVTRLVVEKPLPHSPSIEQLSQRARHLNNHSVRLDGLDRREEALAAVEESVAIRRALNELDSSAFRSGLAGSLNNLSNHLDGLGRRQDALVAIKEAVVIRRELSKVNPEAFRRHLAASLNNLSSCLDGLGRWKEALAAIKEAVAVYRELSVARLDPLCPDLAGSLHNLSNRLNGLGRREEALLVIEEAVAIRRELSATRPDAFRSDFAMSLSSLSSCLHGLGRREEALEAIEKAVSMYRKLSVARPDAFRSDLAMSLNNLSNYLRELGCREEALAAIDEAVAIRRELSTARPDVFRPDLAMSLNNFSNHLDGLGRREEALVAIEEAVAIRRQLSTELPGAFRSDLAGSLSNLSGCFAGLGCRKEALAAIKEAVAMYQELATERPAIFNALLVAAKDQLCELSDGSTIVDEQG